MRQRAGSIEYNALAVIGLIGTGLAVLFDDTVGLSAAGKVMLKSIHVSFGYVMAAKVCVAVCVGVSRRSLLAVAQHSSRRARILRCSPRVYGFVSIRRASTICRAQSAARIGVALLFLFLLIQVVTGLVIAGTDLFWPPFGHLFAAWVAAPGIDPTLVVPGATDLIDKTSYDSMRVFRRPFVEVHEFGFYALAVLIVVHLIAVVTTEIHEGGSITSAMFTGRQFFTPASRRFLEANDGRCVERPVDGRTEPSIGRRNFRLKKGRIGEVGSRVPSVAQHYLSTDRFSSPPSLEDLCHGRREGSRAARYRP